MRRAPAPELIVAGAVSLALAAFVVVPLVLITLGAFVRTSWLGLSSDQWIGEGVASLDAIAYIVRHYGAWLAFSGWIALLAVAIGLLVAAPAGYVLVRHPFRGSRLLEELVLLPLSLPGIAMSVGLLAAYPSVRGGALVLAGHLLYTLPFFVRVVMIALRTRDVVELEAAARTLGASFGQRVRWVVVPSVRPALMLGALLVFTISWGEFNVSYLLNSGSPQTFPAALYNTYANESFHRSSAATAVFLSGVLPVLAAIQWLGGLGTDDVERGA